MFLSLSLSFHPISFSIPYPISFSVSNVNNVYLSTFDTLSLSLSRSSLPISLYLFASPSPFFPISLSLFKSINPSLSLPLPLVLFPLLPFFYDCSPEGAFSLSCNSSYVIGRRVSSTCTYIFSFLFFLYTLKHVERKQNLCAQRLRTIILP